MTRASPTRRAKQSAAHCHFQVKKTAIGLADAAYDDLMHNNKVWEVWKKTHPDLQGEALRKKFVAKNWGRYIDAARTTMALLLTQPIDQGLKDQIEEALILDRTLMRGRRSPAQIVGRAP